MLKKFLCIITLIVSILCVMVSCETTDTTPTHTAEDHTFSNGTCTICNLSAISAIGSIVKNNPDQYTAGAYIKSFTCASFSTNNDASKYAIGFAYEENTGTLLILLSKKDSSESISILINNGVIANRYKYMYSYTNDIAGFTDKIEGMFYASSLSNTSSFTYTDYTAGSGKAFSWFVDDYTEDAAKLTKLLVEYLNEFLENKNIGFTAEVFNLK